MQPYFFPYIGYFQLIRSVDRFVLLDTVQFKKGGWIARNRVLQDGLGWRYINVPVARHASHSRINEVVASPGKNWKRRLLRQIRHYKQCAPYYDAVSALLADSFELEDPSIARINAHYLQAICRYLAIDAHIETLSAIGFDSSTVRGAGDWGLVTSRQLGASEYVNMIGGAALFDRDAYAHSDVRLTFLEPRLRPYDQRRGWFEPALSIIDVLMFNGPALVRTMLDDAVLL